jgi:hypothetical protein
MVDFEDPGSSARLRRKRANRPRPNASYFRSFVAPLYARKKHHASLAFYSSSYAIIETAGYLSGVRATRAGELDLASRFGYPCLWNPTSLRLSTRLTWQAPGAFTQYRRFEVDCATRAIRKISSWAQLFSRICALSSMRREAMRHPSKPE